MEGLDLDRTTIFSKPDDFNLEANICEERPIVRLDADYIVSCIDDSKFSENNYEKEQENIAKILNECCDFEKINYLMPKLWYPTREKITFTKTEMLDTF